VSEAFYVEQVNPNDSSYKILVRHIENFQKVAVGDLAFDLEGQKASIEINIERDGYFYTRHEVNDVMGSMDVAYYICDTHAACLELSDSFANDFGKNLEVNSVLNFNDEEDAVEEMEGLNDPVIRIAIMPGGRAYRQIQDAVRGNSYLKVVGYFDDAPRSSAECLGGIDFEIIQKKYQNSEFDRVFVAAGSSKLRIKLINNLVRRGIKLINIIHPNSFVSEDAILGCNIYIGPFVQVASKAVVSDGAFISAGSNIEHHCHLAENCLLGPGVYLSGGVSVGKRSILGAGVSVESNIEIGDDVYVTPGKGLNKNIKNKTRLID
jgi:acetyltransferase-like isoleucine patch superfamily enzyme